jgi:DNA invertase Pin-like site-specific DNA recombinase
VASPTLDDDLVSDGRVYNAEKCDMMELMQFIMIASRANEESVRKRERGKSAWSNKRTHAASQPMTSMCPGWLRLSHDRKRFEKIPNRVKIVESIFEQSASGIGNYAIAKWPAPGLDDTHLS